MIKEKLKLIKNKIQILSFRYFYGDGGGGDYRKRGSKEKNYKKIKKLTLLNKENKMKNILQKINKVNKSQEFFFNRIMFTRFATFVFISIFILFFGAKISLASTYDQMQTCAMGDSNGTSYLNPDPVLSAGGLSASTVDSLEFLYEPITGNGQVVINLADVTHGGWGGVEFRQSCDAGSKFVGYKTRIYNPNVFLNYRSTTNGATVNLSQVKQLLHWMKVVRTGDVYDVYTSYNGTTWQKMGSQTVAMGTTVLAGFYAENAVAGRTTDAYFSDITITDTVAPSVVLTYSNNPAGVGIDTITATYSENIVGTPNISINQPGSTDISSAPMTGSGRVWTYNYTVNTANDLTYIDGTATVSLSAVVDGAGNVALAPINNTFVISTVPPTVAISYTANPVGVGSQTITATYSKAFIGEPTISIDQPGSMDIINAPMRKVDAVNGTMADIGLTWSYVYDVHADDGGQSLPLDGGAQDIQNIQNYAGQNNNMTEVSGGMLERPTGGIYLDGLAVVSLSHVTDAMGNQFSDPTNNTFTIKTVGPTVSLTYTKKVTGTGVQKITATFTESLAEAPTIGIDQPGTADITNVTMTGSGRVWTYDYTVNMANGSSYIDGVAVVSISPVKDILGNVSSYSEPIDNTFTINTTGPNVVLTYSANTIGSGTQRIIATYSQAVLGSPIITINQPGTQDVTNVTMSGTGTVRTYDYIVHLADGSSYVDGVATVSLSPVVDMLGNPTNAPSNTTFEINTTGPTVALTYGSNPASVGTVLITATYSTPIVGTPKISIDQPGIVDILDVAMSGSGASWTYTYTVHPTDGSNYLDGNAIVSLSSVTNAGGIPSNAPTNNILVLNTAGPTVALTYGSNPAGVGANTITATYSKEITGEPTISIDQPGSADIINAVMSGTGLTRTYSYTVHIANGTTYKDGVATVSLSSVQDSSGNISNPPTNNNFTINTTGPSVALSYTSNTIGTGETQRISAKYSKPISSIPNISLDQQGTTDISNIPMTPPATVWSAKNGVETNAWTSVTYGNGKFVAVAVEGKVMTSTDGATWVERTPSENNTWTSVTYGNGTFVAVSQNGRAMTSTDGILWTARTPVNFYQWNSVAYGNGKFVAVASSGVKRVMTSTDGATWSEGEMSIGNTWTSVTYGNGMFVAVAYDGTNRVATSTNGIIWTERSAGSSNTWTSVTYGNGTFVAVADDGGVMTSTDGITWTPRTAAEANAWKSVTYNSNLFVAVASSGTHRVMTSSDGTTWTAKSSSSSNSWQSVTYGNSLFVVVASDGTSQVMNSADGYYYDYVAMPADGVNYIDGLVTVSLSTVTDLLGASSGAPTNNTFLIQNGFSPTGIVVSSVFDTTASSTNIKYNSIMWKGTLGGESANEGKVRFQLATSASPTGPWNYYGGATCGAQDWFDPQGPNNPIELKGQACLSAWNGLRYFRYKVQMCSSNDCTSLGTSTPIVDSVVVNWSP